MTSDRRSSVLASLMAWLCLCGGLTLLSVPYLGTPLLSWEAARRERLAADAAAETAVAEVERLTRLIEAIQADGVFRDEWVRAEWNLPTQGSAELLELPPELRIDPRTVATRQSNRPHPAAWTLPLRALFDDERLVRTLQAIAVLAITAGLLIRPDHGASGPVLGAFRSISGRYRRDDAEDLSGPHTTIGGSAAREPQRKNSTERPPVGPTGPAHRR